MMKICLGQVKVIPGNPQKNLAKVIKAIEKAKNDKAEIIVFPEMVIPGYLLGDMWERNGFIKECEECNAIIAKYSKDIVVVWGNVCPVWNQLNEDGRVRKYNAAFVAINGGIVSVTPKTLQPNYREFDDNRHFYDNRKKMMDEMLSVCGSEGPTICRKLAETYKPQFSLNDRKIAVMLCEDGWDIDYALKPFNHYIRNGANMVINISCSPYTQNKNSKRNRIFSKKAKLDAVPIVYVNNVGMQNNGKTVYVFDGNSCIYDKYGNQMNPYDDFSEESHTFDVNLDSGFGNPSYSENDDISMLYKAIVYGTKMMMDQLGVKRVVIGASGGVDSALSAAIYSKILSPENIYLVNMPSQFNSNTTKDLAKELADNIGCNYSIIPISESTEHTREQLEKNGFNVSKLTFENIQARDRSSRVLAAISASVGGVFTCNGNKSEMTVGYATLYGDVGGWFANIADLWKGQVYEMAKYINSKIKIIPQGTIDLIPSAELSEDQNVDEGKGDPIIYPYHDKLFRSWVERWDRATPEDVLEWWICDRLDEELGFELQGNVSMNVKEYLVSQGIDTPEKFIADLERWWNLYDGMAISKRIQAPPVLAVSRRAYGFDHRESQMPPYYSKKYYELKDFIISRSKV